MLYEGLPHQMFERELLQRERETKAVRVLHDYPFYQEKRELSVNDAKLITQILANQAIYQPFWPILSEKLCGGFHPDYTVEWQRGADRYQALICFGCGEVQLFGPWFESRYDFGKEARVEALERLLNKYRKNRPAGPLVVITTEHITIEGKPSGSIQEIERLAKLQKVDELFETLKRDRVDRQAAFEAFPGAAWLVVAPDISGRAFVSVFQTIAFAGFTRIHVAVDGRYYEIRPILPERHVATPEEPSKPRLHDMHVQADEHGWRLRVPRAEGPLDASGEGERSSVESFREAAEGVLATVGIGSIVAHVAHDVSFSRFAPFLSEVVDLSERAHVTSAVTLSVRDIDTVQGTTGGDSIDTR